MSPPFRHDPELHGTRRVISTVRTLMRTEGLNVPLASVARDCGTTRNFLYQNWKSVTALHLHALQAELADAFVTADRACPSDGTVPGITRHLVEVVRTIRRHPTTAALARSSPKEFAAAHTALDGPLVGIATDRIGDLLHPLCPHGGIWGGRALSSRPWKILWIARPVALCPEAAGDRLRENTLDNAFTDLLSDLLEPWASE
ncbi:hypothetical protein [Streptomyces sp. NPDC050388]|uniref:hypothetical protein n=1 Tax=Streptomyces sp. NPDC050388 TaxID=3155781 RepID=UPI00342B592F